MGVMRSTGMVVVAALVTACGDGRTESPDGGALVHDVALTLNVTSFEALLVPPLPLARTRTK